MSDEPTAGEARTGTDAPPTEKPDAAVLGRGETHIPDEDAVLLTDGGVETAEELEYDPRAFDFGMTPAVVEEVRKDDVVNKVSFADVQLRECGALYWTEWSGASGLLPQWRWCEVRYLDTERSERDGNNVMARICSDDWDRLPDAVREEIDREETDEQDLVADGGTVAANGGTSNRFPELADIHRDILLTLARSGPTHGRGLMDDLATLRDEDITDSRLYRNLGDLDGLGLVEIREHVHDDRSHEYALTAQGRSAVREHAQRVTGAVEALQGADR
jgi:DNA-binding PadR family transcriptional regulator